jgi:hypothetical protein
MTETPTNKVSAAAAEALRDARSLALTLQNMIGE